MSDCSTCPVEKECHYPFKPCPCVHQRKFWDADRRREYDVQKTADPENKWDEMSKDKP